MNRTPKIVSTDFKPTYIRLITMKRAMHLLVLSGADKWPITVCSVQIFNKDFFGPIFFALCPQ